MMTSGTLTHTRAHIQSSRHQVGTNKLRSSGVHNLRLLSPVRAYCSLLSTHIKPHVYQRFAADYISRVALSVNSAAELPPPSFPLSISHSLSLCVVAWSGRPLSIYSLSPPVGHTRNQTHVQQYHIPTVLIIYQCSREFSKDNQTTNILRFRHGIME